MLKLIGPGGSAVASSDTGTSPEAVTTRTTARKIADGTYQIVVCPFDDPTVPASADAFDYTGGYAVNTAAAPPSRPPEPVVEVLRGQPAARAGTDNRIVGCFLQRRAAATSALNNPASRGAVGRDPATGRRRSRPRATPPAPPRRAPSR